MKPRAAFWLLLPLLNVALGEHGYVCGAMAVSYEHDPSRGKTTCGARTVTYEWGPSRGRSSYSTMLAPPAPPGKSICTSLASPAPDAFSMDLEQWNILLLDALCHVEVYDLIDVVKTLVEVDISKPCKAWGLECPYVNDISGYTNLTMVQRNI